MSQDILAKILSDRERVKQNQPSKDNIKDTLRNKRDDFSSYKNVYENEKQPKVFDKVDNVIIPDKFKQYSSELKKIDKLDKNTEELIKKVLNKGEWIDKKALKSLIDRYPADEKTPSFIKDLARQIHDEPYVGDIHNVIWRTASPNKNLPHPMPRYVEDLKGTLGKDVPTGGADPFAWLDAKYKVTRNLLERNYNKPLTIQTRSDLIAHDDYMEVINPNKHKIMLHVLGTSDRALARTLEPGAPSTDRRLKAAEKLADAGYDVTVVQDILIHPNMPNDLKKMLFKSVPKGSYKTKINEVKLTDKGLEKILKVTGMGKSKKDYSDYGLKASFKEQVNARYIIEALPSYVTPVKPQYIQPKQNRPWKALYKGRWYEVLDEEDQGSGKKNKYYLKGVKGPVDIEDLDMTGLVASTEKI